MSTRSHIIRLAASLPKGDPTRRKLLSALSKHGGSALPMQEQLGKLVMQSVLAKAGWYDSYEGSFADLFGEGLVIDVSSFQGKVVGFEHLKLEARGGSGGPRVPVRFTPDEGTSVWIRQGYAVINYTCKVRIKGMPPGEGVLVGTQTGQMNFNVGDDQWVFDPENGQWHQYK